MIRAAAIEPNSCDPADIQAAPLQEIRHISTPDFHGGCFELQTRGLGGLLRVTGM